MYFVFLAEKVVLETENAVPEYQEVQIDSNESTTVLIRQEEDASSVTTMQVPSSGTKSEAKESRRKEKAKQMFPCSLSLLINSRENLQSELKTLLEKVPLSESSINSSNMNGDLVKQIESSYLDSIGDKEESTRLAKLESKMSI